MGLGVVGSDPGAVTTVHPVPRAMMIAGAGGGEGAGAGATALGSWLLGIGNIGFHRQRAPTVALQLQSLQMLQQLLVRLWLTCSQQLSGPMVTAVVTSAGAAAGAREVVGLAGVCSRVIDTHGVMLQPAVRLAHMGASLTMVSLLLLLLQLLMLMGLTVRTQLGNRTAGDDGNSSCAAGGCAAAAARTPPQLLLLSFPVRTLGEMCRLGPLRVSSYHQLTVAGAEAGEAEVLLRLPMQLQGARGAGLGVGGGSAGSQQTQTAMRKPGRSRGQMWCGSSAPARQVQ